MNLPPLKKTLLRSVSTLARRVVIGRVPKLFDADYYLQHNSDVRESGVDPYLHYVLRGASQDRDPAEDFDTKYFREQSGATRLDPIRHYLRVGVAAGLDPNPNFSTTSYLKRYPDVADHGINPLLHYRLDGRREGRLSEASVANETGIPALHAVLSRHRCSLPRTVGRPFTMALLREENGAHAFERAARFCAVLKLTNSEIELLANAFSTMGTGDHAAIRLKVEPEQDQDRADESVGAKLRPQSDTLLLAFEHCHVAHVGNTILIRYAELRLWDLRPQRARVAEIYPAGIVEIQT